MTLWISRDPSDSPEFETAAQIDFWDGEPVMSKQEGWHGCMRARWLGSLPVAAFSNPIKAGERAKIHGINVSIAESE
jgi:hypothetical protein